MERLTGRYKGRYGIETSEGYLSAHEISGGRISEQAEMGLQAGIDRLAAYEDIGLTPEQILEVDRLYAEKCREVAMLKGGSGARRYVQSVERSPSDCSLSPGVTVRR